MYIPGVVTVVHFKYKYIAARYSIGYNQYKIPYHCMPTKHIVFVKVGRRNANNILRNVLSVSKVMTYIYKSYIILNKTT